MKNLLDMSFMEKAEDTRSNFLDTPLTESGIPAETPTGKPWDLSAIPIPGGLNEKPTGKPWDLSSIAIPGSKEIPEGAYNELLTALQKTYKESADQMCEVIEMIKTGKVPFKEATDPYVIQESVAEFAMMDAYFESFVNGPFFESVKDPNKKEIRKVISSIQKKKFKASEGDYNLEVFCSVGDVLKEGAKQGAVATAILTVIGVCLGGVTGGVAGAKAGAGYGAITGAVSSAAGTGLGTGIGLAIRNSLPSLRENKEFSMRAWQMLGTFAAKPDDLNKALKHFSSIFSEELGDMILNGVKLNFDGLTADNDGKCCYLLIVDSNKTSTKTITVKVDPPKKEEKKDDTKKDGDKDKDKD